ncbi:DgyrCDS9718 [Dimorphilus gyrociliatus]|uniref:Uridylate-specific endoribonuclease n=1 Tax=Dimorphilus gyrociliatus TaxID=2664684 RepID=A0A7I8VXS6_9ANNE|nr:DgyrCDS9718 [Dimorphilus gyrociliatus]
MNRKSEDTSYLETNKKKELSCNIQDDKKLRFGAKIPSKSVSQGEVNVVSSELWTLDTDRAGPDDVIINTSGTELFQYVNEDVLKRKTFAKFDKMRDNYNPDIGVPEPPCSACRQDESEFLDMIIETPVMQRLWNFFIDKDISSSDKAEFKQQLYDTWFKPYSRSNGPLDSSGFEHVFLGETRNSEVTGFHNWVQYYREQQKSTMTLKRYLATCESKVSKISFEWDGFLKPITGFWVGTTPEIEMALYTLCFLGRPNQVCSAIEVVYANWSKETGKANAMKQSIIFSVQSLIAVSLLLQLGLAKEGGFLKGALSTFEGQTIKFGVKFPKFSKQGICEFGAINTHAVIQTNPKIFNVGDAFDMEAELTTFADSLLCSDYSYEFFIICEDSLEEELLVSRIKVFVKDQLVICRDPHFSQSVEGTDDNFGKVKNIICYDLYGKSLEKYEIISDLELGGSVQIELRDDYYIGRVILSSKLGKVAINTTHVSLPSNEIIDWNNSQSITIKDSDPNWRLFVRLNGKDISIEYENGIRKLNFGVFRIKQEYGESFLNVKIDKSTAKDGIFDKLHGGIFGEISKKQYQFFEPVQANGKGVTAVKVDGRIVKSSQHGMGLKADDKCISISLGELLYPKTIEMFKTL